jgi:hypothetical protein
MVRAATSKNERLYYVPMNDLAFDMISRWRSQRKHASPGRLVSPLLGRGKVMDNRNT